MRLLCTTWHIDLRASLFLFTVSLLSTGAPPLGPMQGKLTPEQQTYFTAPTMPACAPPARPPPSLFTHANVLRAFDAHTAAECTVREGEVVEVLHPDPSGWTEVRAPDGRRGWVPSTYLSPAF